MTPKERQKLLFDLLQQSADSFRALTEKQMAFAVDQIDATRRDLIDMLEKYTGDDGKIKRERILQIMKDLDKIEARILENGMDAMTTLTQQTADFVANDRRQTMTKVLGDVGGSTGIAYNSLSENVVKYVATRFAADGLVLSDRVWQLSGQLRDQLGSVIRQGILQGKSLNTLIADVRRVYQNDTWKIRRLVLTEQATAYRAADALVAQQSSLVKGLKIHKGKADRPEHMCSILASQDRFGLGVGVYPANNVEIMNPHPNCTSWLEYVLDEEEVETQQQKKKPKQAAAAPKQPDPEPEPPKPTDPLELLEQAKTPKELEKWAKDHLNVPYVNYKDYDDRVARHMNEMMYKMKQRYPEAFDWGMKSISTCQDADRRSYEFQMEATILHNLKNTYWQGRIKDVGESAARQELRDAIVKKGLVKRKKTNPNTNAFASTGGTGVYEPGRGIYINKSNAGDLPGFNAKKRYAEQTKWSVIGSAQGTMIHEYGHVLDYWLKDVGHRKFVDDMWAQASQQDVRWWKEQISEYGMTNDREMFAELFSEYILKDNPRPLAAHFGKMVEEQVAKYRRGK